MLDAALVPSLLVFAAVARAGSFTGAARTLKLSKSVVSERVRGLESAVGQALLVRTTRQMRLTQLGARLLELSADLEGTLRRAGDLVAEEAALPKGVLTVGCTIDLGELLVAPVVARFVASFPQVRVEVISDDVPRDVMGVDVAVRLGTPRPSAFTLRRLLPVEEPLLAAPAVAARVGQRTRPSELADIPWVRHSLLGGRMMRFLGPGGSTDELTPRTQVEANNGRVLVRLLMGGAGVGAVPEYLAREHLLTGHLVRVCPSWVWKRIWMYALLPPRPQMRAVHRAFIQVLEDQLLREEARWKRAPAP